MHRRRLLQAASLGSLLGAPLPAAWSAAPAGAAPYAWRSVPFGAGGFVDGFLFHPTEPGLLYARTDIGGAYRFDTAANAWVPLLDHLSHAEADLMGVLSLAVDPADPDRLYAACGLYLDQRSRPGALLASTDRGATWQVHELGLHIGGNSPGRGSGERLQVDPHEGQVLWLGSSQDGLLRSTDRGRSFSRIEGFTARHVSLVLIDPASGTAGGASRTVYAGSHDEPGLYVSHDGGQRFSREAGTPRQVPQHAAIGPDGSLYVSFALGTAAVACNPSYAKTGSVWKRDAEGRWTDITPEPPGEGRRAFGYSGLDVDRRQPGRLVVSTIERWAEGDEIFVSEDGGTHWTALGALSQHEAGAYPWLVDYMRTERNFGHWTSDVKLDPFNGDRALYGTGYGVWVTRNLGAARNRGQVQWVFTVANFEETATLVIRSPATGPRLLAAMGDVAGGAWDDPSRALGRRYFTPPKETNRSVDFAELAQHIVARTGDGPSSGYWSDDGGLQWQPFETSPRTGRVQSGSIAVSARGGAFVYAPQKGSALWSHDRGRRWAPCLGWPASGTTPLRAVADRAAEGVFYVLDSQRGQLLASRDGGRRFKPLLTGLPQPAPGQPTQLVSAPGTEGDLWLALGDRLLHVPARGREPKALPAVAEAWMLALGKGVPGAAYHSLYLWGRVRVTGSTLPEEGLFRSDDAGASFTRINDDQHRYGRLLSMAADAREHGVLYLAPHGRGVVVGRPRAGT
ncbi:hypothetical protein [Ideonella sp. BN130291]|uniref:hypothetical protein n=1 Tax=Ideonella sp. BN130291 TaxID=3112940 RepID=UPI002E27198C|nr:hypothetical protein [Ideonella sp. BN130291]